jgi:eukaryotic-like serine/threonine-protein kinase
MVEESQKDVGKSSNRRLPSEAADAPRENRTIGEFRLLRKIGQGGMAEVWLAEQTSLERKVALKLLHPELTQEPSYVARFQREASAAGALNHPNIVQVHVVGEVDGQHYLAQEYVKGQTLKVCLRKKGPLELPLALHIMRQVAAALKAAGDAGIVHRDIKPENIMISKSGDVKVADFGLAQLHGTGEGVDITQEGTTLGTPLYMSPEQINGSRLDPRSDLYSFGVTCYQMLTGRPPYEGPTAMSIAARHLNDPVPLVSATRPDLPPALSEIVSRLMAKYADERYQTADDLQTDLRRVMKAVRQAQRPGQVDTDILSTTSPRRDKANLSSRATVALLVLMFVATAAAGAGAGWFSRATDPLGSPESEGAPSARGTSARDQYVAAMLAGGDEDTWTVMINQSDPVQDRKWMRAAQGQLALLYLQDESRWQEADAMLRKLESYRRESSRYEAQALAGRAAMAAYRGDFARARTILQTQLRPIESQLPKGSGWQLLVEDVRTLLNRERERLRGSGAVTPG